MAKASVASTAVSFWSIGRKFTRSPETLTVTIDELAQLQTDRDAGFLIVIELPDPASVKGKLSDMVARRDALREELKALDLAILSKEGEPETEEQGEKPAKKDKGGKGKAGAAEQAAPGAPVDPSKAEETVK